MSSSGAAQTKREKEFPGQHEGETVQFLFRQHPLVMRKALIGGLLLILLAVLPFDFPQIWETPWLLQVATYIVIGLPVFVVLMWIYRWMGWYYTVYLVTDQRLLEIHQKGLFDRKVDEWQLDGITNVNYHINGFQAVLFGYGDILVRTYVGEMEMPKIHKPAEIHEKLLEAVRRAGGGSTQQPGLR